MLSCYGRGRLAILALAGLLVIYWLDEWNIEYNQTQKINLSGCQTETPANGPTAGVGFGEGDYGTWGAL